MVCAVLLGAAAPRLLREDVAAQLLPKGLALCQARDAATRACAHRLESAWLL